MCSIEGCGKPYEARGWCKTHYNRWRSHGDPLEGRPNWSTAHGEAQRFLRKVVLAWKQPACLFWPFRCSERGYAQIQYDGKTQRVHRLVCEIIHGPPPTSRHYASHNCGRGHLGCVSPWCVEWKTPKENKADELCHGTRGRGERNGRSKLTDADAREICRLLKVGRTQQEIAKQFGMASATISAIKHRRIWAWLERERLTAGG